MDDHQTQIVREIGKRLLEKPRPNKDFIVKSLRQAAGILSELDQSPTLRSAVNPLSVSFIKHGLLQHRDRDVELLVAICVTEIIRVLAPEPPFDDSLLPDVFRLMLSVFAELADTESPYFSRRVKIIETIAELKFCIQMLDIDCDGLILEMFNTFFSVVRQNHQSNLINAILSIMVLILKEEVSQPLLEVILRNLLKDGEGAPPASSCLAVSVIKSCCQELERFVCRFIIKCISDKDSVECDLKDYYHKIILKIFQYAPQMLVAVIPSLTQELLTDQVDVRIKAVNLIGKLFALPGCHVAQECRHLFAEFLKRFEDKSAEVRLNALQCARECYLANPWGAESLEVLSSVEGRLLDFDDRVRTQAVVVACDIARSTLKYVPADLISRVSDRLRDKKISVRKNALQKLLEVYRDYCIMCAEAHLATSDQFEQIPCRVLMLCYDKDCKEFRAQNLENVLAEEFFPSFLSVEERTRHWIYLFSHFTPAHVRALNSILSQKQRFQAEMRSYLAICRKEKYVFQDNGPKEVKDRLGIMFKKMSLSFPDPCKAEECFHKLHQVKEKNIFGTLSQLLGEVTVKNIQEVREKLLRIVGDRSILDFLRTLSAKCSLNIFCSDYVRCILDSISDNFEDHSINLLVTIVSNFPSILRGFESQFQELFEENPFEEKLIKVLAIAGSHICINPSDFYPILERVCVEGTRTQSKLAVSAIAALGSSSELYLELFKKLVVSLHAGKNLPTVLQSLGCIAQNSPSTFQMHDREIIRFISKKIFQGEQTIDVAEYGGGSDCSASCKIKVYSLKMLVKCFLPHQSLNTRCQIIDLLDILSNMLCKDEDFDALSESDVECMRLAAASAVLRLSRRWDFHINPQLFHSTVLMAKHSSSFVRKSFLNKTHKYLRVRAMPNRYACSFALAASDSHEDLQADSLKYMEEFVREHSIEGRIPKSEMQGKSVTDHPAYFVVYLIHVLAHDSSFPPENCLDEEVYAHFCSPLYFALRALVNTSFVDGAMDLFRDSISYLLAIFRATRKAEDAVDAYNTRKLHILSDIGISILSILNDSVIPSHAPGMILLPSSMYRYAHANANEKASFQHFSGYAYEKSFLDRIAKKLLSSFPGGTYAKNGKPFQEDRSRLGIEHRALDLASCKQVELPTKGKNGEGKSMVRCGKGLHKSANQETSWSKQKLVPSSSASGLINSDSDSLMVAENRIVALGDSHLSIEKEQQFSSCDSVTNPSSAESQDLSQSVLVLSSCTLNRSDGARKISSIREEHSECCGPAVKDLCSSKSAKLVPLIQLSSQSDDRLSGDPGSLSTQQESVNTFGNDTAQLLETLPKNRNSNMIKSILPSPVKRKKCQSRPVAPLLSEVVNVNDDIIARRTRSRKL